MRQKSFLMRFHALICKVISVQTSKNYTLKCEKKKQAPQCKTLPYTHTLAIIFVYQCIIIFKFTIFFLQRCVAMRYIALSSTEAGFILLYFIDSSQNLSLPIYWISLLNLYIVHCIAVIT